jgi:hypothetical protein
MNDEKIYTPEVIVETPFPGQPVVVPTSSTQETTGDVTTPAQTRNQVFPIKRTAVELLSQAINTHSRKILQEFQFTPSGALQIGDFEQGQSGDIRISPNGIVARDLAGAISFLLDALTGDAIFKGEIRSGSVVTGQVVVGNNRVIIDVDANGEPRIIVNDGTNDRVLIGFGEF